MKVVTCLSDVTEHGYRNFLKASCRYHEIELVTLQHRGPWISHRIKDHLLRLYARRLPPEEIILFTDGYDSMLVCGEAEVLAKYSRFAAPLVFTAEKTCWPCPDLADAFPSSGTPFRYLNSGGFIGQAGVLVDVLNRYASGPPSGSLAHCGIDMESPSGAKALDARYAWSNQYYWTLIYLHHRDLVTLDHGAAIFLEVAPDAAMLESQRAEFVAAPKAAALYRSVEKRVQEGYVIEDGRVRCKETGSTPCQVHFNGLVAKRLATDGCFDAAMPWFNSN
jgi:hypothetical protein